LFIIERVAGPPRACPRGVPYRGMLGDVPERFQIFPPRDDDKPSGLDDHGHQQSVNPDLPSAVTQMLRVPGSCLLEGDDLDSRPGIGGL
jgi:hypothetical protein